MLGIGGGCCISWDYYFQVGLKGLYTPRQCRGGSDRGLRDFFRTFPVFVGCDGFGSAEWFAGMFVGSWWVGTSYCSFLMGSWCDGVVRTFA